MLPDDGQSASPDPVEAALNEFCAAWYSEDPPDPEAFLRSHAACGPELEEQIENLLLVDRVLGRFTRTDAGAPREGDAAAREVVPRVVAVDRDVPARIGDFEILRLIGAGGMGTVYEATQLSLRRRVALKVLAPHLSLSERAVLKFQREAEAGARQRHPGIVAIHAVGECDGLYYIAQELVEGGYALADKLEELGAAAKGLPGGLAREMAELIAEVADALRYAHESGVIHRDIKPSNILLDVDRRPKVTDFGLARVDDALTLSRTGDFAGTPFYMSPEQVIGDRAATDFRSDVYSLGVTLYEALTLARPFDGETTQDVLKKILLEEPTDPRRLNARLPRDLALVCLKAMAKDRRQRYQSMAAFAGDLRRFLNGEAISARPPGLVTRFKGRARRHPVVSATAGVAVLALVVLVLYIVLWSYPRIRQQRDLAQEKQEKARVAEQEATTAWHAAELQTELARARLEKVLRLADLKRLSNLIAEERRLWPAHPENVPAMESWVQRAQELLARIEVHNQTLAELRAIALAAEPVQPENAPGDSAGVSPGDASEEQSRKQDGEQKDVAEQAQFLFEDEETQWWHDTLQELVEGLEALGGTEKGLLAQMQQRLLRAQTIRADTVEAHQQDWEWTIAAIADRSECPRYDGLVIEPQTGLIPIGRNRQSGLWEFLHLQSGELLRSTGTGRAEMHEGAGLVMVLIPGGSFGMGAVLPAEDNPEGQPNVDPHAQQREKPVHEVTIAAFFLSKYEVTQAQWLRMAGTNPSYYHPGIRYRGRSLTLMHPVETVSWDDCVDVLFKNKLRLPTEAEWEYAARAGTTTIWWTGDDRTSLKGAVNIADNFCRLNGGPREWEYERWLDDGCTIHTVIGNFRPNAFGLHDVIGNVWEWCQDEHHPTYEGAPTDSSPWRNGVPLMRISRGGAWPDCARIARSAARVDMNRGSRNFALGLRPALSIEDYEEEAEENEGR